MAAILTALGLLYAGCVALVMAIPSAPATASGDDSRTLVHHADIRSVNSAAGTVTFRCGLCEGTGRAPHFGHTADGQYFTDGEVVCPRCNGAGILTLAQKDVEIVPD